MQKFLKTTNTAVLKIYFFSDLFLLVWVFLITDGRFLFLILSCREGFRIEKETINMLQNIQQEVKTMEQERPEGFLFTEHGFSNLYCLDTET